MGQTKARKWYPNLCLYIYMLWVLLVEGFDASISTWFLLSLFLPLFDAKPISNPFVAKQEHISWSWNIYSCGEMKCLEGMEVIFWTLYTFLLFLSLTNFSLLDSLNKTTHPSLLLFSSLCTNEKKQTHQNSSIWSPKSTLFSQNYVITHTYQDQTLPQWFPHGGLSKPASSSNPHTLPIY